SSHGTRCAGTVAAAANASLCTVGVAFQAQIGGIRMLGGDVTDMVEARSLSFRPHYVDIYLASWGPEDDGATLEGPGPLTQLALQKGVQTGRSGRGSIFVWASGNGGRRGDHCSCDGYGSSIYTISVSSGPPRGHRPDHQERCASILTTSSTSGETEETVTLGPQQTCSRVETDTSLSAAAAAGVIALTLEANPSLTWRDVQHIIVRASRADRLEAPDWHLNGGGFKVSHLYGFGLLDAEAMVTEAERWNNVPPQHECVQDVPLPSSSADIRAREFRMFPPARAERCYAEHVVARVTIAHNRRGDLSIRLTSPSGTVSQLLANRPNDDSTEGFNRWEFMTTHCWGERPAGRWTLEVRDSGSQERERAELGALKEWSLVIYGTAAPPHAVHVQRARSAEGQMENDFVGKYEGQSRSDLYKPPLGSSTLGWRCQRCGLAFVLPGPCDPECGDSGCAGPGPHHCITCLHFFLKFKNNTRTCVSQCPRGFWGDRRRCKKCYSTCESCTGSRNDQCTSCQEGHHLVEDTNTCTAACGDGYYLDHDANVCRKCNQDCLRCTSSSICTHCSPDTSGVTQPVQCLRWRAAGLRAAESGDRLPKCMVSCAPSAFRSLQGTRCQQSCPPGFYHDGEEGACKPCDRACATCAGERPGPQVYKRTLVGRCDASCLTCEGASRANCSSCSDGHSLLDGVCVVNTRCTDGQFQDGEGRCHACQATCLRCTGPQPEDCVGCDPLRALDDGRCVAECATGKYRSGGRCHLCDHTCGTCVDAGPANCTSCDTDRFGVERYLHRGQCVDACPEAFYHTAERSCERCSDHCRLCTSAGRCLRCNPSYSLSDGLCAKLECGGR
ncbi:unnamed protein product, partial [Tetraodon nigroviridis]